jgi:hypothetical protein
MLGAARTGKKLAGTFAHWCFLILALTINQEGRR